LNYNIPVLPEIKKVSENYKEILKKYKPIRAAYLEAHPQCEALLNGCKVKASEVHHKCGKASEELYLDTSMFLAVCGHCHSIITKNSAWAIKNGFSVSRLAKSKQS